MRRRGSILPFVIVVLALLFVAGPLALMGQQQLRALQLATAARQADDLAWAALAHARRGGATRPLRLRCPPPGDAAWRFRSVRIGGRFLGEYAALPLRAARGRAVWCVAGRTLGGPLNEGQRVEVYYRVTLDRHGRLLRREALR
ncbi:hypothetical protein [Oceanithermus desulfurans]